MVSLGWERSCSGSTVPILPGLRRQYKNGVPGGDNYPYWPDKYPAGHKFPDFQAAFAEFLVEMAGYSKMPVKILRLPKCSAPGAVRQQRGIFTGRSFWRSGVEDGPTTSKNAETRRLTPGFLREYASGSECERNPVLRHPRSVNKPTAR